MTRMEIYKQMQMKEDLSASLVFEAHWAEINYCVM